MEVPCIPALVADKEKLQNKLADREMNDATRKTALKGQRRKRATASDNLRVELKAEFEEVINANARLVYISGQSKDDAVRVRVVLGSEKIRLGKVKQASKLTSANLCDVRMQSARSVKAAEEALRQLTEWPRCTQLFVSEVRSLKLQNDKMTITRDEATSSATETSRQTRLLEACIDLL